jgi:hypothetical protein
MMVFLMLFPGFILQTLRISDTSLKNYTLKIVPKYNYSYLSNTIMLYEKFTGISLSTYHLQPNTLLYAKGNGFISFPDS